MSAEVSKIQSTQTIETFHNVAITTAADVEWVDMRDFENFLAQTTAMTLVGAGVDEFSIIANDQSNGGGTDVEIAVHAIDSAPDAVEDSLFLEVNAEQVRAAGDGYRYVSAKIAAANAGDVIATVYVRAGARNPKANLTADSVA